jgi:hypothetical protein
MGWVMMPRGRGRIRQSGPDLYKQQDPAEGGYIRNGATDMGPPATRTFVEAKARRGENQGRV